MSRKFIGIILLILNVATFVWIGVDKNIAQTSSYGSSQSNATRMSEVKMVAVSSFGSAPSALIALKIFKHKTSAKKAYLRNALWLVMMQNILFYVVLFKVSGRKEKNKYTRSMYYGKR